jgi:hypothetical protein
MKKLHFCGGLPRSGSTVLMNILQQNPRIFTTGTCALPEILHTHILVKSRFRESFQAMSIDQADRAVYGLIHGATRGWFEALTNKPVVISKNRMWSELFHLYDDSKYIVTVRDLRDIVESFEKVNSKTLALHSFGDRNIFVPAMHKHEKYRHYFDESNSLSVPLSTEIPRMMEVFGKKKNNVLFVRYEDFTKDPIYILRKLYNFLEEDWFEHDLNHISQSELFEHDHAYFRERTDHVTKSKFVYYKDPVRTLPDSFHERVLKENNWFYKSFYPEVLA